MLRNMKRGNNPENNSENKETGCENKPVFRIIPFVIGALAVVVLFVGALVIGKKLTNSKNGNNPESVSGGEIASGGEITSEQTGKLAGTEKIITGNGINDTGDFTLYATEYEGRKGTGKFNYGEALQKSLLFYELQRSGDLPEKTRCNWRGDSALADGSDVGHDLTGGLYDAGDHVKFNLPMAYTAAVLSWSVYENRGAYEESGQLGYALSDIRWIDDYLIKCHTGKEEFYYQVGNGSIDHSWWGPCEVMTMERPAYKVDAENPGSTVVGEAAAALAAGAVIFETDDKEYSEKCLKEAARNSCLTIGRTK